MSIQASKSLAKDQNCVASDQGSHQTHDSNIPLTTLTSVVVHTKNDHKKPRLTPALLVVAGLTDVGRSLPPMSARTAASAVSSNLSRSPSLFSVSSESTQIAGGSFSSSAIKYAFLTVIFATSSRILDAYSGKIESKGVNSQTNTLAMFDGLILAGLGFSLLCAMYFVQPTSIFHLPIKHVLLIAVVATLELIQGTCDIIGTWTTGAATAVLFNGVGLVFNIIVQKLKFREPWYRADVVATLVALTGLSILFVKEKLSTKSEVNETCTRQNDDHDQFTPCEQHAFDKEMAGLIILTIGQILKAFEAVFEEQVMKTPLITISPSSKSSKTEFLDSRLFLATQGFLGFVITALVILIMQSIDSNALPKVMQHDFGASNGKLLSFYDFCMKCWNNYSLMAVVGLTPIMFLLWCWSANLLVANANSIAQQVLSVVRAIPVWFATVFIFQYQGEPLQKFDATQWYEYLVFIAFIFFIASCCIFFEFGVPSCLNRHYYDQDDDNSDTSKSLEKAND